jgi:hypothetical protein
MAVAFWLGRFFSKLQWNLANASKRERRYAKMQRRARRKQDGLASQLEDLEYRVMLSGVVANPDTLIAKQLNQPVNVDVLSNDQSDRRQKRTCTSVHAIVTEFSTECRGYRLSNCGRWRHCLLNNSKSIKR